MLLIRRAAIAFGLAGLAACTEAEIGANSQNGQRAIADLGCGACHVIPGVAWPQAHVGPALHNYAERSFIAGKIPNTQQNLAAFITNATQFVPEGAMPAIAMDPQQAQDIAAYLLTLRGNGTS